MNSNNKETKVVVGLSGGVDSSVAAHLLIEQGYDVVGVHMVRWDADMPGCTGHEDRKDALTVAKRLGIPFRVVDLREIYKEKVIDDFIDQFKKGLTPNPDIWCNEYMKFGAFYDYAINELGADYVATGHYAQIIKSGNQYELHKGVDESKDQSYFLYRLNQGRMAHIMFPLGAMKKSDVRRVAATQGLDTAHKKDSVGICFIGDIDIKEFLKEHIDINPGDVLDVDGEIVGRHDGAVLYTIGQRHGFELFNASKEPQYVVAKNAKDNTITVGRDTDSDVGGLIVENIHTITVEKIPITTNVRFRHLGEIVPSTNTYIDDNQMRVEFASKPRGIAPGQHAVFYKGAKVLGGGIISATF